jgi:hypothetical protein
MSHTTNKMLKTTISALFIGMTVACSSFATIAAEKTEI